MKILRQLTRLFPLSPFGLLTLLGAMVLWAVSAANGNSTGLVLATLAIFFTCLNAVVVISAASNLRDAPNSWAVSSNEDSALVLRLEINEYPSIPLLRMHLRIRGNLRSSGHTLFHLQKELRLQDAGHSNEAIHMPMCGVFQIEGVFMVRDILGLCAWPCGRPQQLEQYITPQAIQEFSVKAMQSNLNPDQKQSHKKDDAERILVRQYTEGDLLRDINWKAAARLGILLTRIPPEAPRESKTIPLLIRMPVKQSVKHLGSRLVERDSVARLARSFLHSLSQQYPEAVFSVCLDETEYQLSSPEDLRQFNSVLAATPLQLPEQARGAVISELQLQYAELIIAAESDTGIPTLLSARKGNTGLLLLASTNDVHPLSPKRVRQRTPGDKNKVLASQLSLLEELPTLLPGKALAKELLPKNLRTPTKRKASLSPDFLYIRSVSL